MNKKFITTIVFIAFLVISVSPVFLAANISSLISVQDKLLARTEEAQFSKRFFALVQGHDLEAVKAILDPRMVDAQFKEKFDEVANIIPNETPKRIKFIGTHHNIYNGFSKISISSEYEFSNNWFLVNVLLQRQGNTFLVLGFNVQPTSDSLEHKTNFSFFGQDAKHYIVFTASILLLLFNAYVLALCIKTPIPKRKWLWIIFILVGFGRMEFNWMNGAFYYFGNHGHGFKIDFFNFPVVGFSQMLYQPFIIKMTVPIGAITFLFKRKRWATK